MHHEFLKLRKYSAKYCMFPELVVFASFPGANIHHQPFDKQPSHSSLLKLMLLTSAAVAVAAGNFFLMITLLARAPMLGEALTLACCSGSFVSLSDSHVLFCSFGAGEHDSEAEERTGSL